MKRLRISIIIAFSFEIIFGLPARADIYHRCGTNASYVDHQHHTWLGDRPYSQGSWGYTDFGIGTASTSDPISGTQDDALYQTERYGPSVGYRYDGLRNGIYNVTLKFCELYWHAANRRIFDIAVNDILFLDDLDIYGHVGHDAALDYTFQVKVSNESLIISVPQVKVDYAKFAAISVVPGETDSTPPDPPTGFYAYYHMGKTEIGWMRNYESDIQGYYVYRSQNVTGPFTRLNDNLIKNPTSVLHFTDETIQTGETYFYYVTAVDASDNESAPSKIVSIIVVERESNYWPIPDCAWKRPMGDCPQGATGRTKRGVPLGGIGAGNFMYNLCGTFGPWEFKTGTHEEKFLSQAAFHVYERISGQESVVRTLATDDVLPAWNRLHIGEGSYYALYPKAWFTYAAFTTDVSLKQFTPIIPHNYKESSYPVAVFQFKLYNPTSDTLEIALMFTFPNADYAKEIRTGYLSQAHQDGDVTGVVLKANSPRNNSVTQNTEWCIATRTPANAVETFTTSWDKDGTGDDIYTEFGNDGELNNGTIDASHSAGAVAVKLTLSPGDDEVIPFVVSWDFPIVRFGEGTEWYRRYTEYFGSAPHHSFQIAKEALSNYETYEAQVDRWQRLVIDEPAYPDWLKQAALNELYYDTFGGVFWENGCQTKPQESAYGTLSPDDHKYFCMECQAYAMCETFDVRHYECRHYLELWPEIEQDVLRWFADYIYNDPDGKAPHDAGRPDQDPFFRFSGYGSDWQDMPSKFIQQVYAYYKKICDDEFLNFVWPACKKTYSYMKTKDTNYNGLPDHGNTTYDTWGLFGDNLLCGGLWVGALEAMEQLSTVKGDAVLLNDVKKSLSLAKLVLDILFWQEDLQYYRLDMASRAIMADGLNGQRFCETTGLDPILPPERIASHLSQVFERCVQPLTDYTGDGIGDMGAMNGQNPDGSVIGSQHPDEVWTGSSYFVAAMMYHWGKVMDDDQLKERALKTAYGIYYQTWVNEETAYFFNTPEAWHYSNPARYRAQQYQRPRAIWELLLEIKNPFSVLTDVGDFNTSSGKPMVPEAFKLHENFPNPFNTTTMIRYELPENSYVTLTVYDIQGRALSTLVNKKQTIGIHQIIWQGTQPSGMYFYKIEAQSAHGVYKKALKMIVVR